MANDKWTCFVCGNEAPGDVDKCPVDGNQNPDAEAPVQSAPAPAPKRKAKKTSSEES